MERTTLSDDELSALADGGREDLFEKLTDDELRRMARILVRSEMSGVGETSVRAQERLSALESQPPIEQTSVIGDAVRGFGRDIAKIPRLGERIASGEVSERMGLRDLLGGEGTPQAPQPDEPVTSKAARILDLSRRAITPGAPEAAITGQVLVNIATDTLRGWAKTATQPIKTMEEEPEVFLMSVLDAVGAGTGARASRLRRGMKAAGKREELRALVRADEAGFRAQNQAVMGEAADRFAASRRATEAGYRDVNQAAIDTAAEQFGKRKAVVNEAISDVYPFNLLPESSRVDVTDIARKSSASKTAAAREAQELVYPTVPNRLLPKITDPFDELERAVSTAPSRSGQVAAVQALDNAADDLASAASAVRAVDPEKAKTLTKQQLRAQAMKERFAAKAGEKIQKDIDATIKPKKTYRQKMDDFLEGRSNVMPTGTDQRGFVEPIVTARVGSAIAGGAAGGAIGAQIENEQGIPMVIPGVLAGMVGGHALVESFRNPAFREAAKGMLSIGGREPNIEKLTRSLVEPLLPDTDIMVMGQPFNPKRSYLRMFTEDRNLPPQVAEQVRQIRVRIDNRKRDIAALAARISKLDEPTQNTMDRWLRREVGDGALSGENLDLANQWRDTMDELSNDIVENGLVQGELVDKILDNVGTYIPRLYMEYEKGDAVQTLARYLRSRGEGIEKLSDLSYLRKRRNLPADVRRALGELTSEFGNAAPGYVLGKRGLVMAADIEYARFANWLASSPDYVLDEARVGNPASGVSFFKGNKRQYADADGVRFVKLGDNKRFGPLRGRYVQEDIAYDMEAVHHVAGFWTRFWDRGTAFFKRSKLLGPAPWARNVMGGLVMNDVAGGINPMRIDLYAKAARDLAKKTDRFLEASEAGALGGVWHESELKALAGAAEQSTSAFDAAWNWTKRIGQAPWNVSEKVHNSTEQWLKMTLYNWGRDKLGLDPAAAAKFSLENGFDYADIPNWVRAVRRSPLGAPFITFSYKALPKVIGSALSVGSIPGAGRLALQGKIPSALRTPFFRFWKYPLAIGAVNEYAGRKFGLIEEEGKGFFPTMKRMALGPASMAKFLPSYVGGIQALVPWRDAFDRFGHWDLTWTLPWGDLGEFGVGPVGKTFAAAGIPYPRQIEPSNPWFQVLMAFNNYDAFRGDQIIKKESFGNPFLASQDFGSWMMRLWMPSLTPPSGMSYEKLSRAISGEYSMSPDVPTLGQAVASELGGVRIRWTDPRTAWLARHRQLESEVRELESVSRRARMRGDSEAFNAARAAIAKKRALFQKKYGPISNVPPTSKQLQDAVRNSRTQLSNRALGR